MRALRVLPQVGAMVLAAFMLGGCETHAGGADGKPLAARIRTFTFGTTKDGATVPAVTLVNPSGASVTVIAYGGIVQNLEVPDKNGKIGNVVLGFDSLEPYETISPFFGALIGRTGNRIAKGTFTLDGNTYHLPINDPPNDLHGGAGYDKRLWTLHKATSDASGNSSVALTLTDPDGREGFPGTVSVKVIYTWTANNTLRIDYSGTTDKATPINLTHHSYFNLKDGGASDVFDHEVQLNCETYTPVDSTLIPTGQIVPVAGTPFDFTRSKTIGKDFAKTDGGYDHNFVISTRPTPLTDLRSGLPTRLTAVVIEPTSGRRMTVTTSEPGLQFYSGNMMKEMVGKGGVTYKKNHAFCMEAQHFPDSPNHANFPSIIVRPGQTYRQVTEYAFSISQ